MPSAAPALDPGETKLNPEKLWEAEDISSVLDVEWSEMMPLMIYEFKIVLR